MPKSRLSLGGPRGAGSLTYRVPDEMPIRPGDLVLVPLQTRLLPGVVVSVVGETPAFPTRPVEDRVAEDAFVGPLQLTLARWIAAHYRASLFDCLALFLPPGLAARLAERRQQGHLEAARPPRRSRPSRRPTRRRCPGPPLTLQQEAAARRIVAAIEQRQHKAFLLHGVTGSGKTHVYFEAVARTLELGRQAIVLVPEIALTPATLARFEERFPGRVAVLHSQLAVKQHRLDWERVRRGEADIVVGSRSALFAPVRRPGPGDPGRGARAVVPPGQEPALPRPRGRALVGPARAGAGRARERHARTSSRTSAPSAAGTPCCPSRPGSCQDSQRAPLLPCPGGRRKRARASAHGSADTASQCPYDGCSCRGAIHCVRTHTDPLPLPHAWGRGPGGRG